MAKKYKNIIYLVCALTVLACVIMAALIYNRNREQNRFVYTDNYDSVLFSIDEFDFTLKDASYYIMLMEANVHEQALTYNSNDPQAYWNIELGNMMMRTFVKNQVYDFMLRDTLYYIEGAKLNLKLDKKEEEALNEKVNKMLKSLTSKQMAFTNFNFKELYDILYRIEIAKLYTAYAHNENATLVEADFNKGGSHYAIVSSKYNIKPNKSLWSKVTLGINSI